ncbi:MAG: hypothetical protein AVDCRST_MAG85-732 [uncultured Solirubrobacteraceae bacterium]|uniref:Acyltransferase 3 domain-containing protein n=1 Tax=uncultured Solirubrobacteraceae bacterium TaxID=1162706 RepID=A0A6J4RVB4_9ACTN|nr:MAG: hypothetical protein AVDCRST_MAG85-732 [uncultured Solirubrobacteraceae bacterium]
MRVYEAMSVDAPAAGDRRSPQLDAVRALAVLMVLAGHAYLLGGTVPEQTSRAPGDLLINAGGSGIWLFFALSGYLIGAPFVRALADGSPLPRLGRYALRRGARILPAYWLALAVVLVVVPPVTLDWWQLPLHGALLHNLVPGEGQALFFVAWTLGIEALFYAFVPLGALAVRRARGPRPIDASSLMAGIGVLWGLSIAWSVWAARAYPGEGVAAVENADAFRLSLPALLSAFCPGLLLIVAERARPRRYAWLAARPGVAVALAVPFAVGGMLLFAASSSVVFDLSHQLWSVAAGLVVLAALESPPRRLLRLVAPLGLVSYGLYLWHYVALLVLRDLELSVQAGPVSWPVRIALLLAISLPFAVASWLLVERPLLRRTARWRRVPRAPVAEGAPA